MYTHVHCSCNNWEIGCRFLANLLPRLLPKQCWPHFEAWGVLLGWSTPWSKRGFGALVVAPMQAVLDFIYSDKLEIEVHRLAIATGDGPRQLLLQNGFKLYEHWRMVLGACLDSPFDEPYHMWMATEWTCKTIAYIWKTSQDDAVRCLVLIRSFL